MMMILPYPCFISIEDDILITINIIAMYTHDINMAVNT